MGKTFFVTFISVLTFLHTFGQKNQKHNELSFSATFFSNKTQITAGNGPFREKKGKIWSNGINATYSRTIVKNIFIIAGAGLYKQHFEISRPINYNDFRTRLLYSTKNYSYDWVQSTVGIGYNHYFKKNYLLKGSLTYNQFNTYKQKYELKFTYDSSQSNIINSDLKYRFGKSYNFSVGGGVLLANAFLSA